MGTASKSDNITPNVPPVSLTNVPVLSLKHPTNVQIIVNIKYIFN